MLRCLPILCTSFFLAVCFSSCSSPVNNLSNQICFADKCIHVETAQTIEEREKGLQDRQHLDKDKGMLFIFSENKRHGFWMKDTFIPLDIIWINQNKRIVTIMNDILPCKVEQCPTYTANKDALYVLEVNAGISSELGLKVGDKVVF